MDIARVGRNRSWLLLVLFLSGVMVLGPSLGGHTVQRLGQVIVAGTALVFLLCCRKPSSAGLIDQPAVFGGGLILLIGVISSLRAQQPLWSLLEMALITAVGLCAAAVALTRRIDDVSLDRVLMLFIVFICAFKSFDFLELALRSFFTNATGILDTDRFLSGFSNKRFYGQFQTFTLPLLTLPLLLASKRSAKLWVFILLLFWWMIAISGGTRGTWLGMGVAACLMVACGRSGRRWFSWQLPAVAMGLLLFWLMFRVLTDYLGLTVVNFAGDRLTTSLSARDVIWQQAWDMIRERPWLGFGPMHFADIHNPIAAHPHQAILQWACEWGIPSTLLVMWLVGRGLWATFRLVRERADSNDPVDLLRVCLFASLIGALTQSMVDGVIVMPYSQLWLSLVVGWLMGIHVWKGQPAKPNAFIHWSWMGISTAAVLFLVFIVIRDLPHQDARNELYQQQYGGHFQPRFWAQGVIAIKPD
ncbi:lipid A core-O-antigen ligase-like enyme [Pseudomonas asplenii]|uniref:Lipid A core-O-antigen ligase-like enyme n=2 Tax=Pseudomonas asplenii TaxID=53407 RepID=A0A0N0E219_9PSED|nr:lipid A core-O-antigen ligase-like enyme [Pseudomonas fuscovaginae]